MRLQGPLFKLDLDDRRRPLSAVYLEWGTIDGDANKVLVGRDFIRLDEGNRLNAENLFSVYFLLFLESCQTALATISAKAQGEQKDTRTRG